MDVCTDQHSNILSQHILMVIRMGQAYIKRRWYCTMLFWGLVLVSLGRSKDPIITFNLRLTLFFGNFSFRGAF